MWSERHRSISIGCGPIRDDIADRLFPGIRTSQTRALHLVLVPRILPALEAARGPAAFPARGRTADTALIEALLAGAAGAGASGNDPGWLAIIARQLVAASRSGAATLVEDGQPIGGGHLPWDPAVS